MFELSNVVSLYLSDTYHITSYMLQYNVLMYECVSKLRWALWNDEIWIMCYL